MSVPACSANRQARFRIASSRLISAFDAPALIVPSSRVIGVCRSAM